VSAKERWAVAQSTLDRLRKFQAQMLRRVQAEASPVIDLELVDSRILQTEVEATAAKTSLHQAVVRLQQLSGMDNLLSSSANAVYPTGLSDTEIFHRQLSQTDWVSVVSAHPLVGKAKHEVDQVKYRLNTKQAEAYPQVFVRVYKPFQRLPNNPDISTTAFVGLRYTAAAGFANLVEAQAISTRILSSEQSVEAAFRETLQILQILHILQNMQNLRTLQRLQILHIFQSLQIPWHLQILQIVQCMCNSYGICKLCKFCTLARFGTSANFARSSNLAHFASLANSERVSKC
jgi:hypothetical protein